MDKRSSYIKRLKQTIHSKVTTRRQLESVTGFLRFASQLDPRLKALCKDLARIIAKSSNPTQRDQQRKIRATILENSKLALPILRTLRPKSLSLPPVSTHLFTDASMEGWGFHFEECQRRGIWPPTMRRWHINQLELLTVLIAVKEINLKRNSHIKLHCDNLTAVQVISRGGSRAANLNSIARRLFNLLFKKRSFLTAVHIQGVRNVLADSLSRTKPVSSEWTLCPLGRQRILSTNPDIQIDLFATSENSLVDKFVSPFPHPQAAAVDAMSINWNKWSWIYLFPPTNFLLKVLQKIRSYKGNAVIIAPFWPKRPWFPLLLSLASHHERLHTNLHQKVGEQYFSAPSQISQALHAWTLLRNV